VHVILLGSNLKDKEWEIRGVTEYPAQAARELSEMSQKMTPENRHIAMMLAREYPSEQYPYVLDGGVGSCAMVRLLSQLGYKAHGHEASVLRIQENCQGFPVSDGLLKKTPYPDLHFNIVSSVECIEHIPTYAIEETFSEMSRIVKDLFIFTLGHCYSTCEGYCSWSAIHPSGMCKERPRSWWHAKLLSAGFVELPLTKRLKIQELLGVSRDLCSRFNRELIQNRSRYEDVRLCGDFNPHGNRYFIYTKA